MKKSIVFLVGVLVVCLVVGGFALFKIFKERSEVTQAEELAAVWSENSVKNDIDGGLSPQEIYESFLPKLEAMQQTNPDVCGWIYIPNTHIDYPVVQGDDNEYYLTHSADGRPSAAGAVFFDKRGTDTENAVVYGHNMGRASEVMFHDLTRFEDESFFNAVTQGYIVTENGVFALEIFAYSKTKTMSGFYSDDLTVDFVSANAMNYRAPESEGQLYTLSTCIYDYTDGRGVLNCVGSCVYNAN